jgi:hypothetical protein
VIPAPSRADDVPAPHPTRRPLPVDVHAATRPAVRHGPTRPGGASRAARAPRGPRALALVERRTTVARPTAPPDPAPIARDLAHCIAEVMTGARELDTIARWITDDVHRQLHARATLAARARSVRRLRTGRPIIRTGSVMVCRIGEDVAETTVVVHTRTRARAVALRLERRDGRWRATSVGVL